MSDKVVYRSTHPDVLAHMERHQERFTLWHEQVRETLAALGIPNGWAVWLYGNTLAGVVRELGDPVPEGWRTDTRAAENVIVPARRTAEGKRIGRLLDGLTQPDPRRNLPGGMPESAWAIGEFAFTRMDCGFRKVGGAAYVTWSTEIRSSDADRIDPAVWERIPLSACRCPHPGRAPGARRRRG